MSVTLLESYSLDLLALEAKESRLDAGPCHLTLLAQNVASSPPEPSAVKLVVTSAAVTAAVKEFETMQKVGPHPGIVKVGSFSMCSVSELPAAKWPKQIAKLAPDEACCVAGMELAMADAGYEAGGSADLLDWTLAAGRPRSEAEVQPIFQQIAQAVAHCHAAGVAHMNLKPENVLLPTDDRTKIVDFGDSHRTDDGLLEGCRGSEAYAAPEVRGKEAYDARAADVFSLGVTLYTMLTAKQPWAVSAASDANFARFAALQADGAVGGATTALEESLRTSGSELGPAAISLLSSMLAINPAARPSMASVLDDAWTGGGAPMPPPPAAYRSVCDLALEEDESPPGTAATTVGPVSLRRSPPIEGAADRLRLWEGRGCSED